MSISPETVKELREKTGCGMMDCKKALLESKGDIDKAVDILRKKGIATAEKKAERVASQGIIESYIHLNSKIGVMLELNCETDFVAKNEDFKLLARDIAMQIAASRPKCVHREHVDPAEIEHEKEIFKALAVQSGKPEKVAAMMTDGRLEKFFAEICLLEQPFIKDPSKSIEELIKENIAKFGENIKIGRFIRYEVGEKK